MKAQQQRFQFDERPHFDCELQQRWRALVRASAHVGLHTHEHEKQRADVTTGRRHLPAAVVRLIVLETAVELLRSEAASRRDKRQVEVTILEILFAAGLVAALAAISSCRFTRGLYRRLVFSECSRPAGLPAAPQHLRHGALALELGWLHRRPWQVMPRTRRHQLP